jgi:hypothetical protein
MNYVSPYSIYGALYILAHLDEFSAEIVCAARITARERGLNY